MPLILGKGRRAVTVHDAALKLNPHLRPSASKGRAAKEAVQTFFVAHPGRIEILFDGLRVHSRTNKREHWAKTHSRDAAEKAAFAMAVAGRDPALAGTGPWRVRFELESPAEIDDGNLGAAFKSLQDAVARWLGTDDAPSAGSSWTYRHTRARRCAVGITIEALAPESPP